MNTDDQKLVNIFKTVLLDIGSTFKTIQLIIDEKFIVLDDYIDVLRKHYDDSISENELVYRTGKVLGEILHTKVKRDYLRLVFNNVSKIVDEHGDDIIEYFSVMDSNTMDDMFINGDDYCDFQLIFEDITHLLLNETNIDVNGFERIKIKHAEDEFQELTGWRVCTDIILEYMDSADKQACAYNFLRDKIEPNAAWHINFEKAESINSFNNEFLNQKRLLRGIIRGERLDTVFTVDGEFAKYIILPQHMLDAIKIDNPVLYKGLNGETPEFLYDGNGWWGEHTVENVDGRVYHCYTIIHHMFKQFINLDNIVNFPDEESRLCMYYFLTQSMPTFNIKR